ncbi:F-box protein At4g35733-like [Corylus avellana]|uniref:F-box protein At4g35733-like n=1 Tax=Corylus avellana TaxID=13451 RepID=UPI00286CB9F2|nr:F-box protein At4g35733-like [Corylus avellana]
MSWADLPEELLEIILKQPTYAVNLYHYRDVCRSWRSVVDKQLCSSPPHLLLYEKQNGVVKRIRLSDVFTGDSSILEIPEFKVRDGRSLVLRSVHPWHRWLVMHGTTPNCYSGRSRSHSRNRKNLAHHICLYNPFSNARIRLPAFTLDQSLDTLNRKFVFSSQPTNPTSIALAVRDGRFLEKLMFLKPGDEEWTTFVNGIEKRIWVMDIICYKGGFCALDWYENIIQFELSPVPRVKKTPTKFNRSSQDPDEYEDDYEFLVESLCGDMLMVHVFCNLLETIKFKVYKLDWERMEWDEIKRLGEEAIFLCCDGSACIRADDSTIYKPNCIYDIFHGDFRVYDLGNETIGVM